MTSTEQTWGQIFAEHGQQYQPATINFYTGGAQSACGYASSAVGPYYCPPNQGVYLDTSFFNELAQRFGAAGDFAQAYVIAHEVGHHIQNLEGTTQRVSAAQQRLGEAEEEQVLPARLHHPFVQREPVVVRAQLGLPEERERDVVAGRPDEVLHHLAIGRAGKSDYCHNIGWARPDKDDIGRFDSDIRTRADRDPDIGLGEGGGIIDAVPAHGDTRATLLEI